MLNTKNYQKYSDKFTIHVLDLTQVHLARKDDKDQELDRWAKMFTASTWEEFKMISADNKYMEEAGKTLFTLNGDDRIREQCEAREDYRRTWESVKQEIEELKALNEKKDALIASLKAQIAELQKL